LAFVGLLALAGGSESATFRTPNFVVQAIRANVARQVGEYAEHYRRVKAVEWLGRELPNWPDPCQVEVVLKLGDAGGATSFAFEHGRVLGQDMTVEGPLERILNSVLPHEVTHTIFAAKFGRPLPRWADEGGAVLSEDAIELDRHDRLVREVVNSGRFIPFRRLFVLTEYPSDVMALYAQGFSAANYLVALKGKPYFLDFVWDGQVAGWDAALASYYGISNTEHLEQQWVSWLRNGRGTGSDHILYAARSAPPASAPQSNLIVRGEMPEDPWSQQPIAVAQPVNRSASVPASASFELTSNQDLVGRSKGPAYDWLRLPREASSSPGQTTVSAAVASPEESAEEQTDLKPNRRRLVPIAVGRTRRDHAP
jgi:hypothetical protein